MKLLTTKTLFLIILITSLLLASIKLSGDIPLGVIPTAIEKEYQRIFTFLAPERALDRSSITVTYFKENLNSIGKPTLPEWGGGGARDKSDILIPIAKKNIYSKNSAVTISHELAHIAINRICDTVKISRFFHEGAAMYLSGDISFEEQSALSMALFTQNLIPLRSIDSVNQFSRRRAQLAYAQSRLAIEYLITNYEREILSDILISSLNEGSFERGLKQELDITIEDLDSLSRIYISQKYSSLFWLIDAYVVWITILVLFITAYVLTILRNRKKREAMEEEELREAEKSIEKED